MANASRIIGTALALATAAAVAAAAQQPRVSNGKITAQAAGMIDFPRVVETAYADGARVFLEMGPGASCARLIGRILGDHVAQAAGHAGDAVEQDRGQRRALPGPGEA